MMEYREKLVQLGITLNKTGKQLCPRCSASRKNKTDKCLSVTFNDDAVLYKCHNCEWSGVVYYRDKYEKKRDFKRPVVPVVSKNKQALYDYFQKRGISGQTLDKYKISINDKRQIIFPYFKNGELVNVKYRTNLGNGKKTFTQESDTEKTLFGMDVALEKQETLTEIMPLIWVEGECDVLAFAEQGIFNVVSIPQGASENKLECIENCFEFIEKFDSHIIAVDNDRAGDKLKLNLLNRLGKSKCKVINWKQYKDANEALIGGEQLQTFIDAAEFQNPDGIVNFYDAFDEIYKFNYENDKNCFATGWYALDEILYLKTGYLMIVTGYPSRGKTTFVDNMLINLSKRYGLKHLIASFESIPASHYNTLLEMYCEKPLQELKSADLILNRDNFSFVADHFYRFDVDRIWTVDEICERAELAVKRYGVKTLVIDPYNRLNNNYTEREDKYIGSILSKLSMLAKKLDILVIFVAHPKKPDDEKMPTMYSISGSGDWYNMADYGIIVHRERDQYTKKLGNAPQVCVAKVKNFALGNPNGGTITLHYNSRKRILEN